MTKTFVALSAMIGTLAGLATPASAADLFRNRHHRLHASSGIYADDYGCPVQEPAVYRPRIANYHEPLCYAARPYGISTHLYDHPLDLVRGDGARERY